MKKTFSLICVLAALICGAVFSGCDLDEDDFVAPKDTWVYKENSKAKNSVEYQWNDSNGNTKTIKFDVYVNYATKNAPLNFKNNDEKKVSEGMNVILVPLLKDDTAAQNNIKSLIQEFKDAANIDEICLFYSFGKNPEAAATENNDGAKPIPITSTLWTLIYNFNRFEKCSGKHLETLTKSLTLVSPSTKLNQKRILYNIIGEKLFAEN